MNDLDRTSTETKADSNTASDSSDDSDSSYASDSSDAPDLGESSEIREMQIQDATDFQARLDDLPRELYDIIQDYTFAAHIAARQGNYQMFDKRGNALQWPLQIIQLSRETRGRYAQEFYRSRKFLFADYGMLVDWLLSVQPDHRAVIGGIFLEPKGENLVKMARWYATLQIHLGQWFGDTVAERLGIRGYEVIRSEGT